MQWQKQKNHSGNREDWKRKIVIIQKWQTLLVSCNLYNNDIKASDTLMHKFEWTNLCGGHHSVTSPAEVWELLGAITKAYWSGIW